MQARPVDWRRATSTAVIDQTDPSCAEYRHPSSNSGSANSANGTVVERSERRRRLFALATREIVNRNSADRRHWHETGYECRTRCLADRNWSGAGAAVQTGWSSYPAVDKNRSARLHHLKGCIVNTLENKQKTDIPVYVLFIIVSKVEMAAKKYLNNYYNIKKSLCFCSFGCHLRYLILT